MSELYKRGLGYPFDEDLLRREIANGLGGHGNEVAADMTPAFEGISDLQCETVESSRITELEAELVYWAAHEAQHGKLEPHEREEVVLLHAELTLEEYSAAMAELAIEHPRYTAHVANLLIARLDELAAAGHPVDAEMYVDAHDLAEEIVGANPDKNAEELTEIIQTMVAMIQADCRRRQLVEA